MFVQLVDKKEAPFYTVELHFGGRYVGPYWKIVGTFNSKEAAERDVMDNPSRLVMLSDKTPGQVPWQKI